MNIVFQNCNIIISFYTKNEKNDTEIEICSNKSIAKKYFVNTWQDSYNIIYSRESIAKKLFHKVTYPFRDYYLIINDCKAIN